MLSTDIVFVSAASIWEISIKPGLDKLEADVNELVARMEEAGFRALPVTAVHAAAGHDLLDIRRDPFDRLLVAQAMTEPLRLLSDLECPQSLLKLLLSLAVEDKVGAYS